MLKELVLMCVLLEWVECGSDLCLNGATIDSITFIDNKKMWFFTSGGHYWILKEEDFPPKSGGTPLPGGFKRGDAAIYRDTLKACSGVRDGEQEIHLIEFDGKENKILIYDTRTNQWINENQPLVYNKDRGLGQAKVDWTQPIDAAFIYKKVYIVVIQGTRYSVVDIQNLCNDKNGWGTGLQNQPIAHLNVRGRVDATAAITDDYFYLFQRPNFWKIGVKTFKSGLGEMTTVKDTQQDIVKHFFKFQEECHLTEGDDPLVIAQSESPSTQEITTTTNDTSVEPPNNETVTESEDTPSETEPTSEETTESTTKSSDTGGGFPWILLIIIVLILLLIILLIVCLLMRRGKDKNKDKDKESTQPIATTPSTVSGVPSKAKSSSKIVDNLSTTSVRSNVGLTADKRSKTTSKTQSDLGSSPSQMSIRSNTDLATTKSEVTKTGSQK